VKGLLMLEFIMINMFMNEIITDRHRLNFKPTFLYIKRHSVTGKLYFGKTTKSGKKFDYYNGSGKYWNNHIKKYGTEFVENIWFCLFTDIDNLVDFALAFSSVNNIVNDDIWANKKIEDGLTGGSNGSYSDESKSKMREAWKTRPPVTEETKAKLRAARVGKSSPAKGKIRSKEAIEKSLATRSKNDSLKQSDLTKAIMRQPKTKTLIKLQEKGLLCLLCDQSS
jgi:hypothetical protein